MKIVLLTASLLCATPALHAQGNMDNMPGMQHVPDAPNRTADGVSLDAPQRPLPPTKVPLRFDGTLQEPEHPNRQTGSPTLAVPDLLADVRTRIAEPLAFFETAAQRANPTLRTAEAEVRRLRAEAKQQGLWANPEVGYEADHIRGGSYAGGEQGGYVQQTIPIGGQRSSARAAVQQQAEAAQLALDAQTERVRSAVQQAFYAALAAQEEAKVRAQLMQVSIDAAETAHQLANVGQADAPDVLQSEVEREEAALEFAASERNYRKLFATLAAVTGNASLAPMPLDGDLAAFPQLSAGAAQQAADASPSLRVAEQQTVAEDAAVRSAKRQMLPELTLHAGLQQSNEPLESSGGRVGVVGVAQAGITLPLWNRNQGAIEAARASADGARAEVQRTHLQLRLQAEQAQQDYATARLTTQRYHDELLPRAQRAYDLYREKYAMMAAAYPQVLVSQRTLFQLQVDYVRALNAAWQNAILLQHGLLSDGLAAPLRVDTVPRH